MVALARLLRTNRDFRRLYLALLVSLVGDWFALVAVSALLTTQTGSASMPAIAYAASVLPVVLATPLVGVLADRRDRRRLLIGADVLRVPAALGLCAAEACGSPTMALACVLLLALLSTFFDPVATAAVPSLVDPADLETANAAVGGAWGAMLVVGAGLGGVVSAVFGHQVAFVVNAASFAVSALLVARIRRPMQAARDATLPPSAAPWRAAWQHLRARPVLLSLLASKPGVGVANGIVGVLPTLALVQFGAGEVGIGVLLAARGVGAMLGPLVFAALRRRRGTGAWLLTLCGAAILLYAAAYALLPVAPGLALAAVLIVIAHVGGGGQWSLSTIGLQVATPDALRGRVMALDFALATAAIGVSSLLAALATALASPAVAIWIEVGMATLYGVTWLALTRRLRRRDGEPLPELGGQK